MVQWVGGEVQLGVLHVIEKIRPGDPVGSGVTVTKPAKSAKKGQTVRLGVQVVSSANLKGGKVVVSNAAGVVLGSAKVPKADGKVNVKVKTRGLKARRAPHVLTVQYLGNATATKSGKAKVKLIVTR